jgi:hypothetical protein
VCGPKLVRYRFHPDWGAECLVPFFYEGVWAFHSDSAYNIHLNQLVTGQSYSFGRHDKKVNAVGVTGDLYHAITASEDGTARVFEIATQREMARIDHAHPVTSAITVAVSDLSSAQLTTYLRIRSRVEGNKRSAKGRGESEQ